MARVIRKNGEGNSHVSISEVFMIISMMILLCCFNYRRLDHLSLKPPCYHNHYIALCVTRLYILTVKDGGGLGLNAIPTLIFMVKVLTAAT